MKPFLQVKFLLFEFASDIHLTKEKKKKMDPLTRKSRGQRTRARLEYELLKGSTTIPQFLSERTAGQFEEWRRSYVESMAGGAGMDPGITRTAMTAADASMTRFAHVDPLSNPPPQMRMMPDRLQGERTLDTGRADLVGISDRRATVPASLWGGDAGMQRRLNIDATLESQRAQILVSDKRQERDLVGMRKNTAHYVYEDQAQAMLTMPTVKGMDGALGEWRQTELANENPVQRVLMANEIGEEALSGTVAHMDASLVKAGFQKLTFQFGFRGSRLNRDPLDPASHI